MNKRIEWIDIVKYVCIICVMTTHFSFHNGIVRDIYNPFFLVLFFFCSGYCYRRKGSFKEHFINKVKQLFIPWFVFSNLNILLSAVLSFKEHSNVMVELLRNLLQIRGYGDILWFLSSLFIAYIAFYFVEKRMTDKKTTIKYLIIFSVLYFVRELYVVYYDGSIFFWNRPDFPWRLDYLPNMLLYMTFGYAFRLYYEKKLDRINTLWLRIIATVVYVILSKIFIETGSLPREIIYIAIDYLKHFLGSVVVIAWCKTFKSNRYISFVGQNTLSYFCIHNKAITFFEVIIFALFPKLESLLMNNLYLGAIGAVAGSLLMSVILIIPVKLLIRYCPKLIGKWPKENNKSFS